MLLLFVQKETCEERREWAVSIMRHSKGCIVRCDKRTTDGLKLMASPSFRCPTTSEKAELAKEKEREESKRGKVSSLRPVQGLPPLKLGAAAKVVLGASRAEPSAPARENKVRGRGRGRDL